MTSSVRPAVVMATDQLDYAVDLWSVPGFLVLSLADATMVLGVLYSVSDLLALRNILLNRCLMLRSFVTGYSHVLPPLVTGYAQYAHLLSSTYHSRTKITPASR